MRHLLLPDSSEHDLAFYLAMEEYAAREIEGEVFFVWRVAPTVIIGRNQDVEAEVNLPWCKSHGVKVIRRKSGGGCVYSDWGNIMLSYISERGEASVIFDCFLDKLSQCLHSLGLNASKSGRNDILVDEKKVSGNAFQMLPDRSIVHGTLLYSTDLDALESAINPPVEKLNRHGIASVRQRVRNLEALLEGTSVNSVELLQERIINWFTNESLTLSEQDVARIELIASEYETFL